MASRAPLIISDFLLSFVWVWTGFLNKFFVYGVLGLRREPIQEVAKNTLSIIIMFIFAYLGKITNGGSYNPLAVLPSAVSRDFDQIFFTIGYRIPAQVVGSITGVRYLIKTFPEAGLGPRLKTDIHVGALTEGALAFVISTISFAAARQIPGSFFRKTWIASVSKLALHILASDLTGGCMNPAVVMGWAYARGDHITKEHIIVYWLAPIEATILAVWIFRLVVRRQEKKIDTSRPQKDHTDTKSKAE